MWYAEREHDGSNRLYGPFTSQEDAGRFIDEMPNEGGDEIEWTIGTWRVVEIPLAPGEVQQAI